jgi:hypothetical protein
MDGGPTLAAVSIPPAEHPATMRRPGRGDRAEARSRSQRLRLRELPLLFELLFELPPELWPELPLDAPWLA